MSLTLVVLVFVCCVFLTNLLMASTLPSPITCCNTCSGQTVTIEITSGGVATGNAGMFVVETLAALRAISSASINRYAFLLGDTVKYDFGAAKQYYWDQASTDADNPFTVVVPDDAPVSGRWIEVI